MTAIVVDAALLPACQAVLVKAHAKLVRAARKAGQPEPALPQLTEVAQVVTARCTNPQCRTEHDAELVGQPCPIGWCQGTLAERTRVTVEVTADRPVLAGWELLAVVEPLNGEALVRQVPGAQLPEGWTFERWRTGKLVCDHCKTVRSRTETFLVRGVDDGEVRQVGRNCLSAFLGGIPYDQLVQRLTWPELVRQAGDGDEELGGRGWEDPTLDVAVVMAWTAGQVRAKGWTSRGAARQAAEQGRDDVPTATADVVAYLLTPPPVDAFARDRWTKARAAAQPTEADLERGAAALAWTRALAPTSEYERNLELVARGERVNRAHLGILCSAVAGYERAHPAAQAAPGKAPSAHVGTVGQRLELELTVQRVVTTANDYGERHLHTLRDAAGNAYLWATGSCRMAVGRVAKGKATVKAHGAYKGESQTVLARFTVK